MKLSILLLGGLVLSANAATYTLTNNFGTDSSAVVDASGIRLTGNGVNGTVIGSAGFGYFTTDSAVTSATSGATLIDSDFVEFGSNAGLFNDPTFPTNFEGIFSRQGAVTGTNLDPFTGKNIYLVISNASTLSGGTQYLVYKLDAQFGAQAGEPINSTITIDSQALAGTLLLGSIGPDRTVGGVDSLAEPSFQLQAIPEPSAALLGGLGALALLRRRRVA
jgi:hypothetical protein